MPIVVAGTDDQKKEWLGQCVDDFKMVSFCLSEPEAGSDVAGLQLLAEKDGDDYILNGTKCWITNGGEADLYTVFATLDRSSRHKGVCAFVVPRGRPASSPARRKTRWASGRATPAWSTSTTCGCPPSQRLGEESEGFKVAMRTLDRTRPCIGSLAVGIARRALEESVAYAKERKAFGFPIGNFQAVQFMLADMAKDIEASRLLTLQSAWMVDQGLRASKNSSFAKCFSTDVAMRDHDRRGAGLRRQRLHPRVPGREADAGRQADADLRGHQPDPAPGDRAGAAQGVGGAPPQCAQAISAVPFPRDSRSTPESIC